MKARSLVFVLFIVTMFASVQAIADPVGIFTVDGKDSVYFAGRTAAELSAIAAGVADTGYIGYLIGDIADFANTSPSAIAISGFSSISISATGSWSHTPTPETGPDGKSATGLYTTVAEYGDFGISRLYTAYLNTLVGVFLSDAVPNPGATPAALSGSTSSPLLNQTFLIGAGLGDIIVPAGATRLYLGLHDGWEWSNNSGSVEATITGTPVPEPSALFLLGLGLAGVGVLGRRR